MHDTATLSLTSVPFLLAAVPAVLSVGLSKGGLTAIGGLAVPLLAFAVPPTVASGIVLPLLCFSDLFAMWTFRHHIDRKLLWPLVVAAIVGVVIGLVTVLFTVRYWLGAYLDKLAAKAPPTPRAGLFWSVMSGFTSFIAHAGGPPLMFYLLPLKLDRMTFTSTTVYFFGIINLIKLPFFAVLGLLSADNLAISAALAPVALIGVVIGTWLLKVMNEQLFYRVSYILTFVAGLKLMWDGLPLS